MGNWTVTWRAVAFDGAPDKWCAVAVSGKVASSAAEAIYVIQTQREYDLHERCPGRAFVDWQATDGVRMENQDGAPGADDWRRLCVMLLLQAGGAIDIDDVTLTQANKLDRYTIAWCRNPTSFSRRVKAYHTPENEQPQDRPFGSAMEVARFVRDQLPPGYEDEPDEQNERVRAAAERLPEIVERH